MYLDGIYTKINHSIDKRSSLKKFMFLVVNLTNILRAVSIEKMHKPILLVKC
jgi:hypothetical protein